ncbi:nitroreductase family protein [Desulfosporosinus sp. SYSU MS00001]|uniref:nitroreductase family protein n=1 Tax=Desulfosporosinus sp. SYSU MS00001 TaxID=3416284 RepID=UPI003CE7B339
MTKDNNQTITELLKYRISLRKYVDQPLKQEDVDWIVEGAMRAPTAGNMMLYSMILITNASKKQILSETCDHQPFIAKAPLIIVFVADYQRWFDYYQSSNVKSFCEDHGLEFRGPDEADLLLACSDALIAAQNAVIAAESRGIGSCYIGDIMENYEKHRELLNLPAWVFPVAMLCFGYYPEGARPVPRPRFDRKFIAFTEQYHQLTPEELADMLATRESAFSPGNPFRAKNFGQWMYARKTGAQFSTEMARSVREALRSWRGDLI